MRRAKLVGGSITRSKSRSRFFYNCCTKPREWTSPGPSLDHLYSTISDKCPAQHTGPIREKALKTSSLSPSADRLTMRRIRLCCRSSQLLPRHPSPTEGQRAGPIRGQGCRYGCGVGGWRPARGCGAMVADGRRDRSMWAWGWRSAIFGARRLSTPTKNPPRPSPARSSQPSASRSQTPTRQKTIRAPEHPRTRTRPQPPLPPSSPASPTSRRRQREKAHHHRDRRAATASSTAHEDRTDACPHHTVSAVDRDGCGQALGGVEVVCVVARPRCGDGGGAGPMRVRWNGIRDGTVLENTPGDGLGKARRVLRDGVRRKRGGGRDEDVQPLIRSRDWKRRGKAGCYLFCATPAAAETSPSFGRCYHDRRDRVLK